MCLWDEVERIEAGKDGEISLCGWPNALFMDHLCHVDGWFGCWRCVFIKLRWDLDGLDGTFKGNEKLFSIIWTALVHLDSFSKAFNVVETYQI